MTILNSAAGRRTARLTRRRDRARSAITWRITFAAAVGIAVFAWSSVTLRGTRSSGPHLTSAFNSAEGRRQTPSTRARVSRVRLGTIWRIVFASSVGVAVFTWSRLTFAPESDSALHLALMRGIAEGDGLPSHLPYLPARILEGGAVEAMFPYSYTPLFHLLGAALYAVGGVSGVLVINGIAAAVVASVVYAFVGRHRPWYIACASALLAFLPTFAQSLFFQMFMEPAMLALYFSAAWCLYIASATRSVRMGILAGVLLGLAVGVRQLALIYVGVLALLMAMHLADRRCWRVARLRLELPWLIASATAFAAAAVPFLCYLAYVSGTIGYADVVLPGTGTAVAIDPVATGYISSITKPDASIFELLGAYRRTLLFNERWIAPPYQLVPYVFFVIGVAHMTRRGGVSRFYARLVLVQLIAEVAIFVTVHASSRYVIASQMLFHSMIPVGAFAAARFCAEFVAPPATLRRHIATAGVGLVAVLLVAPALFSAGYANHMSDSYALRDFRSRSYAEAGTWLNEHTPDEALVLTPRTYTAELKFERDIAWVTFFGNAWVVQAISSDDPGVAHAILTQYGVDYVLIPAPLGVYIDRMPADGMRRYLQLGKKDSVYFSLQYVTAAQGTLDGEPITAGLRVYSVNSTEASR